MPGVRQNSSKSDISRRGDLLRDVHRLLAFGLDSAAMGADIYFEKHLKRYIGLRGGRVKETHGVLIVSEQVESYTAFPKFDRLLKLSLFDRNCIRNVRETVLCECAPLFESRDGDRTVVTFGLDLGHLNTLVRLDMRAKADIVSMSDIGNPFGIAPNPLDVEQETRRIKVIHSIENIIQDRKVGHRRRYCVK